MPQIERRVPGDLLEVPIGTQELDAGVHARLGNDAVDGAPDGDPLLSQTTKQGSGPDVGIHVRTDHRQGRQNPSRPSEPGVGPKPLQHLGDDYRNDCDLFFLPERKLEAFDVRRRDPIEVIRPRVGVDYDHR